MSKKEDKKEVPKISLSASLMPLWERLPVPCRVYRRVRHLNNKIIHGTAISKDIAPGGYPFVTVLWDGENTPIGEHVNVIFEDW